jgi:hypothetical protein
MLVDPNNRLVADTLEREWNGVLRSLTELQEDGARSVRRPTEAGRRNPRSVDRHDDRF